MNKLMQLAASTLLATGLGLQTSAAQADRFLITYSNGYYGHAIPSLTYYYNDNHHGYYPRKHRYQRHYNKHHGYRNDRHHGYHNDRHDGNHHGNNDHHKGHKDKHYKRPHKRQHRKHERMQQERHHSAINRAQRR